MAAHGLLDWATVLATVLGQVKLGGLGLPRTHYKLSLWVDASALLAPGLLQESGRQQEPLQTERESGGDDGGRGGREGIVKVGPARCLHKGNQADLIFLSDQGKVFTAQKVKRERTIG